MRTELSLRGLTLVVEYDYIPGDDSTGWPDGVDLLSVWQEGIEESPDTDILSIISKTSRQEIECKCLESYAQDKREELADVPNYYREAA